MNQIGNLLRVNLTTREIRTLPFPVDWAKTYFAGRGVNSFLLFREVPKGADPLEMGNLLLFSAGLLTGTEVPASSRLHVSAKSPLTGGLGSSNVGGGFGARLRSAGYQTLILEGRAEAPCILRIEEGAASLEPALDLWGMDTWQTQEILRQRIGGQNLEILAIGPAGENGVRFASIMTGRGHSAGRTGMGAVMGAKNLKAIVVRSDPPRGDRGKTTPEAIRRYYEKILKAPRYQLFSRWSNTFLIGWANQMGILSTRNYQKGTFEGADRIDGLQMAPYLGKSKTCHRCPVHCKAEVRISQGRFAGTEGERPDLEPIIALGSKCGVDNPEAILYLYNLCSRLGLDVLTMGSSLAFAMEAYEKGILGLADTDGIELRWGDDGAMEKIIRLTAQRRGIGEILSGGLARAAQRIGRGAEQIAYHCKGLDLTGYDPRGLMATALGYAVSTRGADFNSVYALPEFKWDPERSQREFGTEKAVDRFAAEGKGRLVKRSLLVSAVMDALGICKVPALSLIGAFDLQHEAELTMLLTGWEFDARELFRIGERIINLENLFNIRHGIPSPKETLPEKFLTTPLAEGSAQGQTVPLVSMLDEFYEAMGWTPKGHPTRQKLEELNLWTLVQEDPPPQGE